MTSVFTWEDLSSALRGVRLAELDEQRPLKRFEPKAGLHCVELGDHVFASGSPLNTEAVGAIQEVLNDPALAEKFKQRDSMFFEALFARVHAAQNGAQSAKSKEVAA